MGYQPLSGCFTKHSSPNHWMVLWCIDSLMILLLANTSCVSCLVFPSSEVLHFDCGSLGLQQWNQWWVLSMVFFKAASGRSCVEGQKRSLFLLNPLPAPTCSADGAWLCHHHQESELAGPCKAGEDRDVKGRKKWGGGRHWWGVTQGERECVEVEDSEKVFFWPMTDGRCCQPGSGSHCLTVTEAWNTEFIRQQPACRNNFI